MISINQQFINVTTFPNGESLIKTDQFNKSGKYYSIDVSFENNNDLFLLTILKGHFDECGIQCRLNISYMPYSRMDRTDGSVIFTLKYVCRYINNLNFYKVRVIEPHSDVTPALLNNCEVVYITPTIVEKIISSFKPHNPVLFFPDAGALKRYTPLFKGFGSIPMAWGNKHRDFATGKITGLTVMDSEVITPDSTVIIVDDLCSYGGTFIKAGEELRKLGASKIFLAVAHCERAILHGDIFTTDIIDQVITSTSIIQPNDTVEQQFKKLNFYNNI